MKRYIILISISFFCIIPLFPQQYISLNNSTYETSQKGTPRRSVEYKDNNIVVSYGFNDAIITEDPLFANCYLWNYNGFGLIDIEGKPSIPIRRDAFSISQYASIEIIDTSYIELPMELGPTRAPQMDSNYSTYTRENTDTIIPYQGFYPADIVLVEGLQSYRENSLLWISTCPVQYDYERKVVRAFTNIKYRITFTNNDLSSEDRVLSNHKYSLLDNIVLNKINYPQNTPTNYIEDNQDYLILSTKAYENVCNMFADWKRTQGFRTHVVLKDNWTSNQVKNTIKNLYVSFGINLKYVFIIGDENTVPPVYKTLGSGTYPTDLYYGCMDGDTDILPDIYRGRIPVNNTISAFNIVNNIINYEKNPPQDSSFYQTGLNCAYFEDNNNDGYEDRRFTKTSEDIKNYIELQNKVVNRVYYAHSSVNPTNWNSGTFSYGELIPEELSKPNFAWNGTGYNIRDFVDQGAFYLFQRGHGSIIDWSYPFFSQDISLSNNGKLPIVFSISCSTGDYSTNVQSLSEYWLNNFNKGCAAIIAATESSPSGYNDAFAIGMFNAIWPEPGLLVSFPDFNNNSQQYGKPVYEIGQILDQGILAMKSTYVQDDYALYTHEIFHCFGDPSMQMYTNKPALFETPQIFRIDNKIFVITTDGDARVSFYNPTTKQVDSYLGSNVEYTTTSDSISICVSRHNYVPYITSCVNIEYVQNEFIDDNREYNVNRIEIGNNVTDKKEQGDVIFNSGIININSKYVRFAPGTEIKTGAKLNVSSPLEK